MKTNRVKFFTWIAFYHPHTHCISYESALVVVAGEGEGERERGSDCERGEVGERGEREREGG